MAIRAELPKEQRDLFAHRAIIHPPDVAKWATACRRHRRQADTDSLISLRGGGGGRSTGHNGTGKKYFRTVSKNKKF
jgi:hypothetical protein